MSAPAATGFGRIVNEIEESLIAIILGLMTVITFVNVIARYVFNTNILWALETTVFLFAWLVLLGASYCVKTRAHLGVDAVINIVSPPVRRILAIVSVLSCLLFSALLLIGAWEYWWPFVTKNVWYEVNDIPMFDWLRFIEPLMNENEPYEKLPRFIPYFALPLGMTLITFRFIQAAIAVFRGETDRIIASHEAEDLVEEAAAKADKGD
ncbi:MAG: TRAP transporter small permease [Geminicoccaceae bacterium]|nr:TRAP transporter small permease [Geminicoccaceae bacterium]